MDENHLNQQSDAEQQAEKNFMQDQTASEISPKSEAESPSDLEATAVIPKTGEMPQAQQASQKKKKKRKKRRVIGIIVRTFIALFVLGVCAVLSMIIINSIGDIMGLKESQEIVEVEIPPNSSVTDAANALKEAGIIDYPKLFRLYIKYDRGDAVNFKFGKFELHPAMPYDEIINELENGASDATATVTFKEGQTVFEFAQTLQDNGVCAAEDFLNVLNLPYDYPYLNELQAIPERMYRLEGYIYPETYEFYTNSTGEAVVTKCLAQFDSVFTQEMRDRAAQLGKTVDEIMIIASIIQAEAPVLGEMEQVSSVYWNRLNNPEVYPKLESDPTARYGNRFLLPNGASQEAADAYNTYLSQGLPPGPINNPGIEAIQAALYPEKTNYYFFCTNLDTLEFFYATTYEEHQENLRLAGLSETGQQE